jgi:hypothetical protein
MRQLGFQFGAMALCYNYTEIAPNRFKIFTWITQDVYASTTTSTSGYIKSSSIVSCAATTRHPVAQALPQPRRAPRVLVSRPQRLYINYTVLRDYSSPGHTGSTLTTPCAATTCLPVARTLPQPCHTLLCRSTFRRSDASSRRAPGH